MGEDLCLYVEKQVAGLMMFYYHLSTIPVIKARIEPNHLLSITYGPHYLLLPLSEDKDEMHIKILQAVLCFKPSA